MFYYIQRWDVQHKRGKMMLSEILDPSRPVPWQFHQRGLRQVVMSLLIFQSRAITLVQPTNDPTGMTWIPSQGGIEEGEDVLAAGRREIREEIPSMRRPHKNSPFRVLWNEGIYLGSAENRTARSGRPSMVHAVAFPAVFSSLRFNPEECRNGAWVFDPDSAQTMLAPTKVANPCKYNIIASSIRAVMLDGLLS